MTRFIPLCIATLAMSACSLSGDYERPYDNAYQPIEPVVVVPFAVPDFGLGDDAGDDGADAGAGDDDAGVPEEPTIEHIDQFCLGVDFSWPDIDPNCEDVCVNPPPVLLAGCETTPSYRGFVEGICIERCEAAQSPAAVLRSIQEHGREMYCPDNPIDPCPWACRMCEGETMPQDCAALCTDRPFWRCVGHTLSFTDPELVGQGSSEDEAFRALMVGSAADLCLSIMDERDE